MPIVDHELINGVTYDFYDGSALHGTDTSLSQSNKAADAKATGDAIKAVDDKYSSVIYRPQTWADVQRIVREGKASNIFSVGEQFVCKKGDTTLIWDIIGIDHDTPTSSSYTHSLTLQLHDCWTDTMQFGERQAFYYAENGLAAGTYNITVGAHTWVQSNVGKTYKFTLTANIPAGGQIVFQQNPSTTLEGASIKTYASATTVTEIETVTMTEGSTGTSLGTINLAINGNVNSIQRALNGSNNYKDSAIRQWLNSSAAAGSAWTSQSVFDRPPTWVSTAKGWMNDIDSDFLSVIGNTTIKTARNTVCDNGGYDTTSDKFFLLSKENVYMGKENNIDEGGVYPYYQTFSDLSAAGTGNDSNRAKKRNNAASLWWLRTPAYNFGHSVRFVANAGSMDYYSARSSYGVAPACNII